MSGTIITTPTLNATETFQVATPFSYSFTYSENVTAIDTPVYFFNGKSSGTCNSTLLIAFSNDRTSSGFGPIYTVSNMSAITAVRELEGDVLECVLPILANDYRFSTVTASYLTFGGPTETYLAGGPPDSNDSTRTHTATFGALGPFKYGLSNSIIDSLQYIPLAATPGTTGPAVSFKIKLARPNIVSSSIQCVITANAMNVTQIYDGQVNVGMIFPVQTGLTRAFTVTAFGSGYGGTGTYTVAPNDAGAALTITDTGLTSTTVAGSGNVVLSNSMTPASGTAQFVISTEFVYVPPGT